MAVNSPARRSSAKALAPVTIHPASESRIERASRQLTGPVELKEDQDFQEEMHKGVDRLVDEYGVRPLLARLEQLRASLSDRLYAMVKREGEENDKGQFVYQTDANRFRTQQGRNVSFNELQLRSAMTKILGATPKQIDKVFAQKYKDDKGNTRTVKNVVEYEFVGVYPIKQEPEQKDED